jgi:putative hydrolase of the HAD superfamily
MLKALVFDMGGTLEDVFHKPEFNEPCGRKLLNYLGKQGIQIDLEPLKFMEHIEAQSKAYRKWGVDKGIELSPYELWSQWLLQGFDCNQDRLKAAANDLADIWERTYYHRSLRPASKPMLAELAGMKIPMGIISNTSSYTQVFEILHEYGIRGYFDTIVLSSIAGFRKPNPALFLTASGALGVRPDECLYVGDTISRDVRGSRLAGYLGCIRINSELTQGSDAGFGTEGEEAEYPVRSLMEIPGIVKKLTGEVF